MEPSLKTIKRLFALSRNQCALSICDKPLVEASGTVTGVICHINARNQKGPRYDAEQSDEDRHSFKNLILMCARHSTIIDSELENYPSSLLRKLKNAHESKTVTPVEITAAYATAAESMLHRYRAIHISAGGHVMLDSPGAVQASQVVIKNQKQTIKILPPEGSIASSLCHRNYAKHLIDRYQEFASKQPGRKFAFPAIHSLLKKRYGTKWDFIPLHQFDGLVSFLQQRVDQTILGSINRSKGIPNYSTFAEYRKKYGGE